MPSGVYIRTEETKKKMSLAQRGKHHSEEAKQKMSLARKGEKHWDWKGGKIKIICKTCKKEFYVKRYKIKNGQNNFFCSHQCYAFWLSKNAIGKNSSNWKGGKVKKICQICAKDFYVNPYSIKKGDGKYCSRKCKGIWQSISRRKKNNPNWKGGISPVVKLIRKSNKYKQWRSDVFIRDNFTCQKCGIKGNRIEAHHKIPFCKLIDEVKNYLPLLDLYEGAMAYTPLWDLDNGITLCKNCHKKINNRR